MKIEKILLILFVISLILSSSAIYLVISYSSIISDLSANIKNLSSTLENVTSTLGSVTSEIGRISGRLEALEKPPKFPVTVVDALGRTVVINSEPKRIVSMAPSITEMLFALGLGDRVVGVTSFCNYPPEVLDRVEKGEIKVIGGFSNPSVEKIVALKPDLVIGCEIHERVIYQLESLGLTVLIVGSESVDDIYKAILIIGKATGVYETSLELINEMKESIKDTWVKVQNATKPKVLIIVWLEPLWVAGVRTYMSDLIELAGGVNAYTGEGWTSVGPESLIAINPDIIIITGHAAPGKSPDEIVKYLEESVPGWENISAVMNNRVYFFIDEAEDALVRPGPRIARAVRILSMILHPEIFGVEVEHIIREVGLIALTLNEWVC